MSGTRRVLLGIAAAGLVSTTAGCAAVSLGDVLGAVGALGEVTSPRAAEASGYEMVPGREYVGTQVVARLSLFGESDSDQCGLSLKQVWRPDPLVDGPRALAGPGVSLWGSRASVFGSGVDALGPEASLLGPSLGWATGIGVRVQPLEALKHPVTAARLQSGRSAWSFDRDSCPAYPETPR
jgi:hypothetical protein